jgi:hypothetical protein
MQHYILELIKDNNRVIVPNFGAFIVAKEKGFTILFNNFLSFNDGLLVEHVMKKEEVDKLEATDRVNKYVELINKTLDTTGTYTIEGLGVFTKDANGILRFTQAEELNQEDFSGSEERQASTDTDKQEELLDLDSSASSSEPEIKPEPTIVSPLPVADDSPKMEVKEPTPIKKKTSASSTYKHKKEVKEEKKKQSMALFIILFVLIPIVGAAAYFLFFSNGDKDSSNNLSVKQTIAEETPAPKVNTVLPDQKPLQKPNDGIEAGPESSVEEKPVVKPKETAVKPVTTPSGEKRHHLITGSFKEEQNADKYIQSMIKKGFTESIKLHRNNMFMVSVGSEATLSKAMTRQEEILNQHKLESWIMTVK